MYPLFLKSAMKLMVSFHIIIVQYLLNKIAYLRDDALSIQTGIQVPGICLELIGCPGSYMHHKEALRGMTKTLVNKFVSNRRRDS